MKGLLIKDIRLLSGRKRSFLIVCACAMAVSFSTGPIFSVGWFVMIGALFALSTIAYDEQDNGMPFLMTLPASRKAYALEKYVFGLLMDVACWLFSVSFCLVVALIGGGAQGWSTGIGLPAALMLLPLLILDISIPLSLKFGAEKGRIYMIVLFGALFGLGYLVFKSDASTVLSRIPQGVFLPAAAAAVAALTAGSVVWSCRIMQKKEF